MRIFFSVFSVFASAFVFAIDFISPQSHRDHGESRKEDRYELCVLRASVVNLLTMFAV